MNKKLFVVLLVVLIGCSGGSPNRSFAKKAIQERFNDDLSGIMVQTGRLGAHCLDDDGDGKQVPLDLTPDKDALTVVAIQAGYLDVKPDGPDYWQVSLTDKGKKAPSMERLRVHGYRNTLNGCDYSTYMFAIASMEVVQVTGIASDQENGPDSRMAEFEWRWKPTELGEMLRENGSVYQKLTPEQREKLKFAVFNPTDLARVEIPVPPDNDIHNAHLPFKKYDDGWRLQAPRKLRR